MLVVELGSLGLTAKPHGFGLIANMRDIGAQQLSRLSDAGARIIDVDTPWQGRRVELPIHSLDQLGDIVAMFDGDQLCGEQPDQIQQRQSIPAAFECQVFCAAQMCVASKAMSVTSKSECWGKG